MYNFLKKIKRLSSKHNIIIKVILKTKLFRHTLWTFVCRKYGRFCSGSGDVAVAASGGSGSKTLWIEFACILCGNYLFVQQKSRLFFLQSELILSKWIFVPPKIFLLSKSFLFLNLWWKHLKKNIYNMNKTETFLNKTRNWKEQSNEIYGGKISQWLWKWKLPYFNKKKKKRKDLGVVGEHSQSVSMSFDSKHIW